MAAKSGTWPYARRKAHAEADRDRLWRLHAALAADLRAAGVREHLVRSLSPEWPLRVRVWCSDAHAAQAAIGGRVVTSTVLAIDLNDRSNPT